MENASKALIIAGAILLSILLIGLGVYIFGIANDAMSGVNMDEQTIATFNSKFLSYEGNQSGSKVKTLLDTVRTHNLTNKEDPTQQVEVGSTAATAEKDADDATVTDASGKSTKKINDLKATIKSGNTYNVSISYDSKSGLITYIGIVKK